MRKLKLDFIAGELRRIALCAVGFVLCLLILSRFYQEFASLRLPLLLGAAAVIALAALRAAMQLRAGMNGLNDSDVYVLEKEYQAPHPVYKVWQGDIHLLPSFIVCRNRGRLLLLPLHRIEKVEERFDRTAAGRIPFMRCTLDAGKSLSIGFSPSRPQDSDAVFAWLTQRLGGEKIRRCQ